MAPVPHPVFISSSCCLACSCGRACTHLWSHLHLPFTTPSPPLHQWSVFSLRLVLSRFQARPASSLAESSPARQDLSLQTGWAGMMPAASHVCLPLSFSSRTRGEWFLSSSLMQTARVEALQLAQPRPTYIRRRLDPAADPKWAVCSSRITHESILEADPIASKAGPVMQVEVQGTAQHMRADAHTIRAPESRPYRRRAQVASRDARHAGR